MKQKFKRNASVILATTLAATLMPTSAFAVSSNTMLTIPTVNKDKEYKNLANEEAPVLQIKLRDNLSFSSGDKLTLTFENAEWLFDSGVDMGKDQYFKRVTDAQVVPYQNQIIDGKKFLNDSFQSIVNDVASSVYTLDQAKSLVKTEINKIDSNQFPYSLSTVSDEISKAGEYGNDALYDLVKKYIDKLDNVKDTTALNSLKNELVADSISNLTSVSSTYNRIGVDYITRTESAKKVIVNVNTLIGGDPLGVGNGSQSGAFVENGYLRIPLNIKATGGQVKVNITSTNGKVSESSVIVANAFTEGNIYVSTKPASDKAFTGILNVDKMVISETGFGKLEEGEYELKLLSSNYFDLDVTDAKITSVVTKADLYPVGGNPSRENDPKELEAATIRFKITEASKNAQSSLGSIIIEGIKIASTRDSQLGDVNLRYTLYKVGTNSNIHGSGDAKINESYTVGKYSNFTVKFDKTKTEIPTLFTGRLETETPEVSIKHNSSEFDKNQKVVEVVFEELVNAAWISNRRTDFIVPEGVKIIAATVKTNDQIAYQDGAYKENTYSVCVSHESTNNLKGHGPVDEALRLDENILSIQGLKIKDKEKGKLTMNIWVSIDPNYNDDKVTLTATGPSLAEDMEVVVANVMDPVTVSFDTKEVKIGYQDIILSDVTIKENFPGALKNGELVIFPETTLEGSQFTKGTQIEATGDIKIPKRGVTVSKGSIVVDITRSSYKEASTIKLTNVGITINRIPAEGYYSLNIGGSAVIQNDSAQKILPDGFFRTDHFEYEKFMNIITAAPDKDGIYTTEVKLSIGSKDAVVGGKDAKAVMDVAPYIENSRTMIPVRAISELFQAVVSWDQYTNTATVYTRDRVIQLVLGEKVMTVNGTVVPMDTPSISKDGRMFVPIAFIANALGVSYGWNDSTKTAVFNPEEETRASKDYQIFN